jgi:hypothetical protein
VDHTIARYESPVFHPYISSQESTPRNNGVVADLAVVSYVGLVHNKVIVTNDGGTSGFGAAMNLRVFSDCIAVTYPQVCLSTLVFQVLRLVADDSSHVDCVIVTYFSPTGEMGRCHYPGRATNPYRPIDNHVGTNFGLWMNLRPGIDNGGGVYVRLILCGGHCKNLLGAKA